MLHRMVYKPETSLHREDRNPFDSSHPRNLTNRWFRAPEVMINWEEYDSKLDIWSVGCIMAEMIRLTPLFPGLNSKDQLQKIISILGKPTEDELKDICKEGK